VRSTAAGTREIRHFGREPGHARRRAARTALLGRGTTLARLLALPAPLGLTTDGSFTLLIPRGLRHTSPRCGCEVGERRLPADAAVADGLPLICAPPREGRRFAPRDHAPARALPRSAKSVAEWSGERSRLVGLALRPEFRLKAQCPPSRGRRETKGPRQAEFKLRGQSVCSSQT
jgi:hypothetical protein